MCGNTTTSRSGSSGIWIGLVSSGIVAHQDGLNNVKMGEKRKKFKGRTAAP
jgi:hypothetical protein